MQAFLFGLCALGTDLVLLLVQALTFILLDVSPSMHRALEYTQKALTNFIASKVHPHLCPLSHICVLYHTDLCHQAASCGIEQVKLCDCTDV